MNIDVIYRNALIRTMDSERPTAQTVGVLNGRIVGFDEQLHGITAMREVDLGGAPVLPGFNDAHHHLIARGKRLNAVDLRESAAPTMDVLYEQIRQAASTTVPGTWILGCGYDDNKLGAHPNAEGLDRVAPAHPVLLEHTSGHMVVANTRAFERGGWTDRRGVPDIDGGFVERLDDGRAQGLLQERAVALMHRVTRPIPLDGLIKNIETASRAAAADGITSVTEPGTGEAEIAGYSPIDFHAYQMAHRSGKLLTRMTLMPYVTALHSIANLGDEEWFGVDLGIATGFGDDWIRLGPVKILTDGSLIGRTAAMRCCYEGEPDNSGFLQFTPAEIRDLIVSCHLSGWNVAAHAIGDRAVDHALDAFERAQEFQPRPARHRIEHFALADERQIARAAKLGIVAVPQGRFISELGDGILRALGPERAARAYRMRSLIDAGLCLPGSSDAPVVEAAPILGIHDMVNRRTASGQPLGSHEAITAEQAVRAYTYGSSYAASSEGTVGVLRAGMLADFVVLSDDLLAVEPAHIRDVTVGATVVGGEPVWNDGAL